MKGFVDSDLVKKIESEEKFTPSFRYKDSVEQTNDVMYIFVLKNSLLSKTIKKTSTAKLFNKTTVGETSWKSRNQELSKFMDEKTAF